MLFLIKSNAAAEIDQEVIESYFSLNSRFDSAGFEWASLWAVLGCERFSRRSEPRPVRKQKSSLPASLFMSLKEARLMQHNRWVWWISKGWVMRGWDVPWITARRRTAFYIKDSIRSAGQTVPIVQLLFSTPCAVILVIGKIKIIHMIRVLQYSIINITYFFLFSLLFIEICKKRWIVNFSICGHILQNKIQTKIYIQTNIYIYIYC